MATKPINSAANYSSLADYQAANRERLLDNKQKQTTYTNTKTGEQVRGDSSGPLGQNQGYTPMPGAPSTNPRPNTQTIDRSNYTRTPGLQGGSSGRSQLGNGLAGLYIAPGTAAGGNYAGASGTTSGGKKTTTATEGGISAGNKTVVGLGDSSYGPYQIYSDGSTSLQDTIAGQRSGQPLGFDVDSATQQSEAGTLTPEQIAQYQLGTTLGGAQSATQNALTDYTQTVQMLGGNLQQGADFLKSQAGTLQGQAERTAEEGLAQNAIDQAQADLEYQAALKQIQENRQNENDYLMQKLASAGAIDSTGGVQMITRSGEKYDSILGNLAGQRQIALSQFALDDSIVRNQYVSTIENVTTQTNQLMMQLSQDFQSAMLEAQSGYRTSRDTANQTTQQAYSDYLTSLYDIQEARKEAEAAAAEAAAKAQQQSFENAVSLAGLTGTYIDPFTGEQIRTLNGLKYDDSLKGGGTGGSYSTTDIASLIQYGTQNGIITPYQAQEILAADKTEQQQWAALLEGNVSQHQANVGQYGSGITNLSGTKWGGGMLGDLGVSIPSTKFPYLNPTTSESATYDETGNIKSRTITQK